MKEKENHLGHRQRAIVRFLTATEDVTERQMLEILLFPVLPRKDVNPIVDSLLERFETMEKTFKANVAELTSVDGVGLKIATHLITVGKILERINPSPVYMGSGKRLLSFEFIKEEIADVFHGLTKEKFLVIFLDELSQKIATAEYGGENESWISTSTFEFARNIAKYQPQQIILAHNHPSGDKKPSVNDKIGTGKIYLLCRAHGIKLSDHVIYTENGMYSFFAEGLLDIIQEKMNLDVIFDSIKEVAYE